MGGSGWKKGEDDDEKDGDKICGGWKWEKEANRRRRG